MVTCIVNVVLFIVFLMAGVESGQVFLALAAWAIVAVIATSVIARSNWMDETEAGRSQFFHEAERDEKEWLEWRYAEEDKDRDK